MKQILQKNSLFIALSLILIAVLGLAMVIIPKGELHLLLCDRHTPALDVFYRWYTTVAEWFPYLVCVCILLFGCIGDGVFATSAMILSALTTQLFKHIVRAPRPLSWFDANMPDVSLPIVDGVQMNYWNSFPSGHTTSFFALSFVLCIICTGLPRFSKEPMRAKNRIESATIQIFLFLMAALGGYSRIYLSQHFAADVFAGVVVGVLITTVCYVVFYRYKDQKWYKYRVFEKK